MTPAALVRSPELSLAVAVIVCAPAAAPVHVILYGAAFTSPMVMPSALKRTLLIVPSASLALAAMAIESPTLKLLLFAGAINETLGALFDFTVMKSGNAAAVAPPLSLA